MESLEPVPEKEKAKPLERVTLGVEESQRVEGWLSQVNEFSKGYLTLSKSDLLNFLVRQHTESLTAKELQQIRTEHYDPVRHITWITPQIKQALAQGDMARVMELQEELRRVELSAVKGGFRKSKGDLVEGVSPRRKRKPKSESMPNEAEKTAFLSEISEAQKSP